MSTTHQTRVSTAFVAIMLLVTLSAVAAQTAQFHKSKHSCEGGDQGQNFGQYSSPEECAKKASESGAKMFMFSNSYPEWGCRECKGVTGKHDLWDVYKVKGGGETSEGRKQDCKWNECRSSDWNKCVGDGELGHRRCCKKGDWVRKDHRHCKKGGRDSDCAWDECWSQDWNRCVSDGKHGARKCCKKGDWKDFNHRHCWGDAQE